jgi:2-amino-4-hydroxy-6-hydroxymethyldihydropteridine diphosphokinase
MALHTVFISLGTNLGDRTSNLRLAVVELGTIGNVISLSAIYETYPWGFEDQPLFYNQVAKIVTALEPVEILHKLKNVEDKIGRKPSFKYGPRLIDLDILMYDDLELSSTDLVIPHPQMINRAFVLVPLAEINPGLKIPGITESLECLIEKVGQDGIRKVEEAIG